MGKPNEEMKERTEDRGKKRKEARSPSLSSPPSSPDLVEELHSSCPSFDCARIEVERCSHHTFRQPSRGNAPKTKEKTASERDDQERRTSVPHAVRTWLGRPPCPPYIVYTAGQARTASIPSLPQSPSLSTLFVIACSVCVSLTFVDNATTRRRLPHPEAHGPSPGIRNVSTTTRRQACNGNICRRLLRRWIQFPAGDARERSSCFVARLALSPVALPRFLF